MPQARAEHRLSAASAIGISAFRVADFVDTAYPFDTVPISLL